MFHWRRLKKIDPSELTKEIAEQKIAIKKTEVAHAHEAALTAKIQEDTTFLVKRGKTNRYGESLMLSYQLRAQRGNG
jgi:hypothetical protein